MTWVWVALIVVAVFVAVDQAALWAERRGWLYWRRRKPGSSGTSGGVIAGFIELFEPGHRHVVDEQEWRRNAITQRQSGDRPFGRRHLDVDLDAGTVVLPDRVADPPD